jgi:hypothetical protein
LSEAIAQSPRIVEIINREEENERGIGKITNEGENRNHDGTDSSKAFDDSE